MTGKVFYAGGAIPNSNNGTGGTNNCNDLTNYYTKEELNNLINKFLQYVSITYADLVALKNASKLVEGTYYKITDYVTTTNGKSANTDEPSRSAGHQFDIVVRATSTSTLSELASASLHEGDTYFAKQNVGAWQIWYDINNDITKYSWAVTDGTGKGVIYRMIDERQNDLPYDFKNIQFYRDKTLEKYACIADQMKIEDGYYYTFTTTTGTDVSKYGDMSLLTGDYVVNNTILKHVTNSNTAILNNIITIQGNSRAFVSNSFGYSSYDNTFGSQIRENNFGYRFYNNICGDNTIANTFSYYGRNNIIYGNFFDNIIMGYFENNTIKTTAKWFQANKINEYFSYNIIENISVTGNTFGRSFSYNNLTGTTQWNNFGGFNKYNTFKDISSCIIGVNNSYNTCGRMLGVNIGTSCNHNTIGANTYYCDLGNSLSYVKTPEGTLNKAGTGIATYGMCYVRTGGSLTGTADKPIDLTGAQSTLNDLNDTFVSFDFVTKQIVISQRTSDGYTKGVRAGSDFNWVEFTSKPQIVTQEH